MTATARAPESPSAPSQVAYGAAWRGPTWTDRLRTALEPARKLVPASISHVGWAAALGGALSLGLGFRWGWIEFRVIGALALAALALAYLWSLGRSHYHAALELQSNRVQVGETVYGRLVVSNSGRRALLPVRVELPIGRGVAALDVPGLAKDEEHEEVFQVPTRRRMVVPVGPVRAVRGDPLGLVRRVQQWTEPDVIYVHPRIIPIAARASGFLRDVEGVTTSDLSSSDVSFHALRDYIPGDDRRSIHWRTTARLGRMMVRQFEETRRSHLVIVFATRATEYADPDEFELAVSIVGSLAMQALREDRAATVVTSDGTLAAPLGVPLMDLLSGVEASNEMTTLRWTAQQAITTVPTASVAALVTGSGVGAADLRSAHSTLPIDVPTFALRAASRTTGALRRIGALSVADVPTLEDLPGAVGGLR